MKVKRNHLSARLCLYEDLEPKSLMPLSPNPDPLVEELKRIQLQCYVWLILKQIYLYWCNYNKTPMLFSGNQLPQSMANSSKTDLKKNHQ